MKKYTVTYILMGGITVEAGSDEDARDEFYEHTDEVINNLAPHEIEITGVYEEGD